MWKILKAEIRYFKGAYYATWGFAILLASILLLTSVQNAYLITMGGSTIAVVIFCISAGVNSDNEKRNRLFVLLPRQIQQIILTQIITIIILLAGMVIIWFITYVVKPSETLSEATIRITTFCSYIINWAFFFWILGDLTHVGRSYLKVIFIFIMVMLILTIIRIGTFFGVEVISWFVFSDSEPETLFELISMVVLSVILIITEYHIFIRRKSYLI